RRSLVDDIGRERSRDAVLEVIAGDRRPVLPRNAITQRELPLGGVRVVRAGVGGKVRGDGGSLLGVRGELVGRERAVDRAAKEGEILAGVGALRIDLVPL